MWQLQKMEFRARLKQRMGKKNKIIKEGLEKLSSIAGLTPGVGWEGENSIYCSVLLLYPQKINIAASQWSDSPTKWIFFSEFSDPATCDNQEQSKFSWALR